jgi:putative Holliday junction resolvase
MTDERPRGALLAFDYGTVRIGIAVCDPDRIIASALETYTRQNEAADAAHYARVAKDQRAVALVVGLPLHANGDESDTSRAARAFAARLSALTGLPAIMWDERFSSWSAEDALREANVKWPKRKGKVDRIAAQMILQTYLDAKCPPHGSDPPPDAPEEGRG